MKEMLKLKIVVTVVLALASTPLYAQDNAPQDGLNGVDLPNPLGIGMTVYGQSQPYQIESLAVQVPGLDQDPLQDLQVDNQTNTYHLRLDYWLLPFLNVFAVGGTIDSSTDVDLSSVTLPMPVSLNDLNINMDGTVYGGGLVLAYGGKKWFGTLSYQLTGTSLDETDSSVSASVLTPTAGMKFKHGAAWVGAMYQNAQEEHKGVINLAELGDVPYEVTLREDTPWNFLVGATYGISKHWLLTAQGGLGDRTSVLGKVEYRF